MSSPQQPYAQQQLRLDEEKKAIVVEYMPLVKFIAQRIRDRLPSGVDIEDLEHAGMLGLIEAACRYDATQDNLFKTYAEHRIRGAILDDLRKNDFMTRTGREKYKLLEQTITGLEKKYNREVTSDEIADALGMKMGEYFEFLSEAKSGVFVSLEEIVKKDSDSYAEGGGLSAPERGLWLEEIKKYLVEAIEKLKHDEKMVLSLYYYDELNMREIGEVLGKTESRICQIHNEVMLKLARRLRRKVDGTDD